MASTFASVLKFRDFRNIWLSQLTSQIALNMLKCTKLHKNVEKCSQIALRYAKMC